MQKQCAIEKKNGTWRVPKITASQDEEITWVANDTDFAVWFPPGRDPMEPDQGNPRGRRTKRKVKGGAAKGTYQYSVFCYSDNTMAEGDSSPTMIIE